VLRELKEELGLTGTVAALVGLYPFDQMNQLIIAYHLKATGAVQVGEELEGYKAVDPERLRPWPFGTGLAVSAWLEARKAAR
jgi:8-oxo-dGTP pyrophosphatase MutT (NUDIX family)